MAPTLISSLKNIIVHTLRKKSQPRRNVVANSSVLRNKIVARNTNDFVRRTRHDGCHFFAVYKQTAEFVSGE